MDIPDDIKEKIRLRYSNYALHEAAAFGYSLAQEKLAEKDKEIAHLEAIDKSHELGNENDNMALAEMRKEIERLKGLAHELWNRQYPYPGVALGDWQQFKKENHL